MLGNFSFGDYFKSEAAAWAWEFATSKEWLGLDPDRLYVTVYQDDDEAYAVWRDEVGVPAERISRWGEDDNFWPANAVSQGPNGPCGPCSEVFYDRGPTFGTPDEDGPNTGSGDRFVEFWNLVFTQFDRRDGGELVPLPQKNIDTGLGFERLVAMLTGKEDAYATELFQPTIRRLTALTGVPYEGPTSVSHRVIADHLRAVAFAITDGVLPANDGAGYVVKMLIRRASRHAWLLGRHEPVLFELVDAVVESMGAAYPELVDGAEQVTAMVRSEEEQFLRTLDAGIQRVTALLDDLEGEVLSGAVAFDLWQTYGFPLDLTQEMASERHVHVERDGYEAARQQARARSRGESAGGRQLFQAGSDVLDKIAERVGETEFVGYQQLETHTAVVALVSDDDSEVDVIGEGEAGFALLQRTPFYAEGGGQVGDSGKLAWLGGAAMVSTTTRTSQGLYRHRVRIERGQIEAGQQLTASVDPVRRETEKHHTATHLLHAALREVLGGHVAQAGSLVNADRLRFDFTHQQALTASELTRVEELVNRSIQADLPVTWRVVPMAEARKSGAMMLFGEKYGTEVRMVSVGGVPQGEEATAPVTVSVELCGGTHVRRTGQIGSLALVAEESVSAGVRRVEARAGASGLHYLQELRATQQRLVAHLGGQPAQLEERLSKLQADSRETLREVARLRDRLAAQAAGEAAKGALQEAGGFSFATASFDNLDATALRNAADALLERSSAEVVVVGSGALLVAKVSAAARERGAHAGNIVKAVAQRGGGGGGGRPDMAQAGVKDPSQLSVALNAVGEALTAAAGVAR